MRVVDESTSDAVVWVDETTPVQVGARVELRPADGSAPVHGAVTALAPTIVEAPARFRIMPNEPRWARAVYVKLEGAALPGQAFDASFTGTP